MQKDEATNLPNDKAVSAEDGSDNRERGLKRSFHPVRVRLAQPNELPAIWEVYQRSCQAQTPETPGPLWTIGVYPALSDLETALNEQRLFAAFPLPAFDSKEAEAEASTPVGAFTLTYGEDENYRQVQWHFPASEQEVSVIHLVVVDPMVRGGGVAGQLLQTAFAEARAHHAKVMHLDTTKVNDPARALYERHGFRFAGEYTLFYEDTGRINCNMFEKLL